MKTLQLDASKLFLTGCILMANIDLAALLDYAAKAVIGGGIWLGYKVIADHLDRKHKNKKS